MSGWDWNALAGSLAGMPPAVLHDTDPYMHGEFFFNRAGLSHVVPNPHLITLDGDTNTVCGVVADSADRVAKYDLCPECVALPLDPAPYVHEGFRSANLWENYGHGERRSGRFAPASDFEQDRSKYGDLR